jgi:MoaA/NifB/PqqE/SkfB family radical SAM enzyme
MDSTINGVLGKNSYITIILTKRCSLECDYCFEDAGPNGANDWDLSALDRCLKEAAGVGYRWVAITGGDPPAHPEFGGVLSSVEDSGLDLFLETNGVLIRDSLVGRLSEFALTKRLRVQTSLDSVDASRHDQWRGKGAHRAAVQGVRKMVEAGIDVHVCKVVTPDDFGDSGFDLSDYIRFCKELRVKRVEVVRSVPMGRGMPDDYRISQDQLKQARNYLESLSEYGEFVVSTHFNHVDASTSKLRGERSRDARQCLRLSGDDPGIVINPDTKDKSNWKLSPCAFLQDIEIGQAGDLKSVVLGKIQKRMEGIRAATMIGFEDEAVWGCTECRPRFLKVLNEMRGLGLSDSAESVNGSVPISPGKDEIIR